METMMSSWKTLESIDQLEKAIEDSFNKPVVLFKHSVSCGISARAKYMLEENWKFDQSISYTCYTIKK